MHKKLAPIYAATYLEFMKSAIETSNDRYQVIYL